MKILHVKNTKATQKIKENQINQAEEHIFIHIFTLYQINFFCYLAYPKIKVIKIQKYRIRNTESIYYIYRYLYSSTTITATALLNCTNYILIPDKKKKKINNFVIKIILLKQIK